MDRLRVGIVGCGGIAGGHARNVLAVEGAEIVGLVDPDGSRLAAMRGVHPSLAHVPTFTTAAELYDAVALDAVQIITPHTLHYEQTLAAIGRGLHVLCEKPLACEPAHVREIARRAETMGVTVTVSYQRRLFPPYLYMREQIAAGTIGEIRAVAIVCGQDWERRTRGSWRQDPRYSGGGMLMDSGSHLVDVLLWLVDQPAATVAATVDARGAPVDIDTTATIRFAKGAQGQLAVIGDLPTTWIESVVVAGSKGVLRYEIEPQDPWRAGHVQHYRDGGIVQPLTLPASVPMDAAWVAAIRGRGPNPAPPANAIAVAELTAAIYEAAREQRVLHLPPAPGLGAAADPAG